MPVPATPRPLDPSPPPPLQSSFSASGSSSPRSAPGRPWQVKPPSRPPPLPAWPTTPSATSVPPTPAPTALTIPPPTPESSPSPTTSPALLPRHPGRLRSQPLPRSCSPNPSEASAESSASTPTTHLTHARRTVPDIARVVDARADETASLGDLPWINHVQIFENRGAMMGSIQPPSPLPNLGRRTHPRRASPRTSRPAGLSRRTQHLPPV